MATLICHMSSCKHRSKRPLRSWKSSDGIPCYGCGLKYAVIARIFDFDGDIKAVVGEENMAACSMYEPKEED